MTLADIERDAELFLAPISNNFDCEYGISKKDAVEGLIGLYRKTGRINYAEEKSIRGEISAREQKADEEAKRRQEEFNKANPAYAQREVQLTRMASGLRREMERNWLSMALGFDIVLAQEKRRESVRQWWIKNGVAL